MQTHKSIFSLLGRNMQAYTISWVTTFFSSIVNVFWSTQVFHYDFVSNIDGALASQIGVVMINELFLLYSVWASRKNLFGIGGIVNTFWILLTAAFICLLIYAPMIAFNTYASLSGVEIAGHSPLYDEINGYSDVILKFVASISQEGLNGLRVKYDDMVGHVIAVVSGVVALLCLSSFFRKRTA